MTPLIYLIPLFAQIDSLFIPPRRVAEKEVIASIQVKIIIPERDKNELKPLVDTTSCKQTELKEKGGNFARENYQVRLKR
uniref:Uncharacterized protein n=1 Tax=candidate division WOR-3 bacterium TaxID=2052148 RepID=A0A7C4TAH8_UNCW3